MTGGTRPMHDAGTGSPLDVLIPAAVPALLALGYVRLAAQARRRNPAQGWSRRRTAGFLAGCALLSLALLLPGTLPAHDFRGHMLQHLLIGMYAPLALVLGAPVTLLLRTWSAARARKVTGLLHSRTPRLLAHPVSALLLSTGTLPVLYCTPLYNAAMNQPVLHWLLHAHFLLSGCLFAHVIAGPDPAPTRPGVPARLVVLGLAVAAHATLSQLMYGGFVIDVHAPVPEVQGAAQLMYYGGDLAELLLAAALVTTWRPDRSPRPTGVRVAA